MVYRNLKDHASMASKKRCNRKAGIAALIHSRDECRQLTGRVCEKLPVELRLHVYRYLWDLSTVQVLTAQKWRWMSPCTDHICTHFCSTNSAHFMLPGYVPGQFAIEAAHALYENIALEFSSYSEYRVEFFAALLRNDWFHRGLVPAQHLTQFRLAMLDWNMQGVYWDEMAAIRVESLARALDVFARVPLPCRFKLTVLFREFRVRGRVEAALVALRHAYDRFRVAAVNFAMIEVRGDRKRDVAVFYRLDEQQWRAYCCLDNWIEDPGLVLASRGSLSVLAW